MLKFFIILLLNLFAFTVAAQDSDSKLDAHLEASASCISQGDMACLFISNEATINRIITEKIRPNDGQLIMLAGFLQQSSLGGEAEKGKKLIGKIVSYLVASDQGSGEGYESLNEVLTMANMITGDFSVDLSSLGITEKLLETTREKEKGEKGDLDETEQAKEKYKSMMKGLGLTVEDQEQGVTQSASKNKLNYDSIGQVAMRSFENNPMMRAARGDIKYGQDIYRDSIASFDERLTTKRQRYGATSSEYFEELQRQVTIYSRMDFREKQEELLILFKPLKEVYPEEWRETMMLVDMSEMNNATNRGDLDAQAEAARRLYGKDGTSGVKMGGALTEFLAGGSLNETVVLRSIPSNYRPMASPNRLDSLRRKTQAQGLNEIKQLFKERTSVLFKVGLELSLDQLNTLGGKYLVEEEMFLSYALDLQDQPEEVNELIVNYVLSYFRLQEIQMERKRERQLLKNTATTKDLYTSWDEKRKELSLLVFQKNEDDSSMERKLRLDNDIKSLERKMDGAISERYQPAPPPGWRDIQARLAPSESFLYIIRFIYRSPAGKWDTKARYAGIIISPELRYPKIVFVENGYELDYSFFAKIDAKVKAKTVRPPVELKEYWAPFEAHLKDARVLYFSGQGIYQKVNPGLFPIAGKSGRILMDQMELRQVDGPLAILRPERETQRGGVRKALLIGDPAYAKDMTGRIMEADLDEGDGDFFRSVSSQGSVPRLYSTRAEVDGISALLKRQSIATELYKGKDACKSILQDRPLPELVHVATHGVFNSGLNKPILSMIESWPLPKGEYPGFSAIIHETPPVYNNTDEAIMKEGQEENAKNMMQTQGFGFMGDLKLQNLGFNAGIMFANYNEPTPSDNGFMSTYDLLGLDMSNTELVTLSACDSGRGDCGNYPGLGGMRSALRVAGAKYVISSYWKASDGFTKDFMLHFYNVWLKDKQPIEAAFRATQQHFRTDPEFGSPQALYNWANFTLVKL